MVLLLGSSYATLHCGSNQFNACPHLSNGEVYYWTEAQVTGHLWRKSRINSAVTLSIFVEYSSTMISNKVIKFYESELSSNPSFAFLGVRRRPLGAAMPVYTNQNWTHRLDIHIRHSKQIEQRKPRSGSLGLSTPNWICCFPMYTIQSPYLLCWFHAALFFSPLPLKRELMVLGVASASKQ